MSIKKHTIETILKISESLKGKNIGNTNGFKKGISPWNKGKTYKRKNYIYKGKYFNCIQCGKEFYRSLIHIKKGVIKHCSSKCYGLSKKGTENFYNIDKGHTVTYKCEECKKEKTVKLAVYNKAKNHFCSKKCTGIYIGRIKSKENHWNWQGGKTTETHRLRTNTLYKKWRKDVLKRDGSKCSECGSTEKLEAHHILGFKENTQQRYEIKNGITLCKLCHIKTF